MQLSPLQLALLSSAFTLGGAFFTALIAGIYGLRAKRNEYVHDYYKRVIDRRIVAYEQLETLIVSLKTAVLEEDGKPYHVLFSDDWKDAYSHILAVMSQALWLSDEAFEKTRELNYLVFRLRPDPSEVIAFGKQNYAAIARLREDLQTILAADMLNLPNVKRFLTKKKRKSNRSIQELEINSTRGLISSHPSKPNI
jgi:hypothetical protein